MGGLRFPYRDLDRTVTADSDDPKSGVFVRVRRLQPFWVPWPVTPLRKVNRVNLVRLGCSELAVIAEFSAALGS
jgi:hypothetical protein